MMRAKRTGIFRSKLESRWSHYMDLLSIPWEYEKELVRISDSLSYLPDFWLPTYGMWLEVKGEIVNDPVGLTIVAKCEGIARVTGYPCILAFYDPMAARCAVFLPSGQMYGDCHWGVCPICQGVGVLIRDGSERYALCPHTQPPTTSRNLYEAATAARQFSGHP